MNEKDFRQWMAANGRKKKITSDSISRLRKIEREFKGCDLDVEYEIDRCDRLMSAFLHMGVNEEMKKYPNAKFPIGKYYMSTYRLALKQYVEFRDSIKEDSE